MKIIREMLLKKRLVNDIDVIGPPEFHFVFEDVFRPIQQLITYQIKRPTQSGLRYK